MVSFIDDHKEENGIEPICAVLPIAPSTYYRHKYLEKHPETRSARAKRDEALCETISEVWTKNRRVFGVRKVWRRLRRTQPEVARCTVARLMRRLGLRGVTRGKAPKTTIPAAEHPLDLVQREFKADRPNQLWASDLTYVPTWQGFVYVAFVIDVYSLRILGWRASRSLQTDLALQLAARETRTTTPWRRRSSGCTKRSSSSSRGLGAILSMWSWKRWDGSPGSIAIG